MPKIPFGNDKRIENRNTQFAKVRNGGGEKELVLHIEN